MVFFLMRRSMLLDLESLTTQHYDFASRSRAAARLHCNVTSIPWSERTLCNALLRRAKSETAVRSHGYSRVHG